jgi:hypothetical protein
MLTLQKEPDLNREEDSILVVAILYLLVNIAYFAAGQLHILLELC